MNLNDLKNIDIGAYCKALMSNRTPLLKGPMARTILLALLGVLLFIVYVIFVFWPAVEQRQMMAAKVDAIPEMEARLKLTDISIRKAEEDLFQAEQSYAALNQLFSVESELEELYQRLSAMATSQGLVINSLTKDGEEAIYSGAKQVAANSAGGAQGAAVPPPANPAPAPSSSEPAKAGPPPTPLFYRIKLKIELSGQFTHYMRYRKLLAEFDKSINIDKEQISLVPGDSRGMVLVKTQLSTFRLPNKLNMKPQNINKQMPVASNLYPRGDFLDDDMRYIKVAGGSSADPLAAPPAEAPLVNPFRNSESPAINNEARPSADYQPKARDSATANTDARSSRAVERDPFARSSSGMIEGGRDPRLSPLLMAPPQSYVITGVIVSSGVKAAMIRTDFRENFVVRIGDRLGNQGGVISDIDMDGIVVKQGNSKIRLYVQLQTGPQYMGPGAGVAR